MLPGRFASSLATLLLAMAVSAILVNHTVDDQAVLTPTVITYTPGGNSWIPGQTCTSCLIPPGIIDPSKAYDGTWFYTGEASTTLVASFTGTAVYVYNILPNTVPSHAPTLTNLSFSMDGVYAGQFIHIPDSTSTVLYNMSIFSASDLANTAHILTISVQGENASHVLFDYLVYTTDDSELQTSSSTTPPTSITSPSGGSVPTSSSPHPSSNTSTAPIGAIVGGVIGTVAILLLMALIFLLYRSKRLRRSSHGLPPTRSEPYPRLLETAREQQNHMRERGPASFGQPRPRQDGVQPSTTNTASGGASSIDPSAQDCPSQSSRDVRIIREQIVELREEFESIARNRVAERMRMLQMEPPPSYEEPRRVTRKGERTRRG
ncbi:hypothetical protein GY45DRAFT_136830 [Cubamyces sp. BRFM 1775]|nr:hypothetical protein GY45DRAFT_136830 [Cubamyces sp. BRFM 1775]